MLARDVSQPLRSSSRHLGCRRCLAWPHLPVEDVPRPHLLPVLPSLAARTRRKERLGSFLCMTQLAKPRTLCTGGCRPCSGGVSQRWCSLQTLQSWGLEVPIVCQAWAGIIFLGNLPDRGLMFQAFDISQPQMKVMSASSRGPVSCGPSTSGRVISHFWVMTAAHEGHCSGWTLPGCTAGDI